MFQRVLYFESFPHIVFLTYTSIFSGKPVYDITVVKLEVKVEVNFEYYIVEFA